MDENKNTELQTAAEAAKNALTEVQQNSPYAPTIWNDPKLLQSAWNSAKYLAQSDIVPEQTYRGKPQNCLIAVDIANRMNVSPLLIMQNLYIVKGKPSWSGQFCAGAINACGRFKPITYVWNEDKTSCSVRTVRLEDGEIIEGTPVTMQMARDEGWIGKSGSKWLTMPQQMLQYRAAAFFARTYCPDVLMGLQTVEEVKDVNGYDDNEKQTVTIRLESTKRREIDADFEEQ